jgi:protein phosphatase
MGGMESGEVASQTAVGSLLRLAAANVHVVRDSEQRYSELKRWISVANEEVCSALDRRHARGGTTIVCGFLWEGDLISAHVGDSRLYLVRGGKAETLTRDHSLAMGLVVQGEISLDEIRHHPDRNRVTRSLGERIPLPEYYADTLQVCTGSPTMLLESGDILMLCSDGLWEPVTDDEMGAATLERRLTTCEN